MLYLLSIMPITFIENESHILINFTDDINNTDASILLAKLHTLNTRRTVIELLVFTESNDYRMGLMVADQIRGLPKETSTTCTCFNEIGLFGLLVANSCQSRKISRSTIVNLSAPMCDAGMLTLGGFEEFINQMRQDHIRIAEILGKKNPAAMHAKFLSIGRRYLRLSSSEAVEYGLFDEVNDVIYIKEDHSQSGVA